MWMWWGISPLKAWRKRTRKDSRAGEIKEDHRVVADKNNCKDHHNRVKNPGDNNSVHKDNSNNNVPNNKDNRDNRDNNKDNLVSNKSHLVNSRRGHRISSSRQSPDSKEVTSQEIPNSAKAPEAIRKKTDAALPVGN